MAKTLIPLLTLMAACGAPHTPSPDGCTAASASPWDIHHLVVERQRPPPHHMVATLIQDQG